MFQPNRLHHLCVKKELFSPLHHPSNVEMLRDKTALLLKNSPALIKTLRPYLLLSIFVRLLQSRSLLQILFRPWLLFPDHNRLCCFFLSPCRLRDAQNPRSNGTFVFVLGQVMHCQKYRAVAVTALYFSTPFVL